MNYSIKLSERAELDIIKLRESGDKQALRKLDKLIDELREHPETGTGKPERLKHIGKWSRRINKRHRLIYEIFDQIVVVEVIQAYGHYEDK